MANNGRILEFKVLDKIGSFSSVATTSMVLENGTIKTLEVFFSSLFASRKLLYKCGDPKGFPALRKSKKEGGHRPPEPSHYIKMI